jgi:hypothetical protein
MAPVAESVKPGGNDPEFKLNVYGAVPPEAVIVEESLTPTVALVAGAPAAPAFGKVRAHVLPGARFTTYDWDDESVAPRWSVTVNETASFPFEPHVIPEMVPLALTMMPIALGIVVLLNV